MDLRNSDPQSYLDHKSEWVAHSAEAITQFAIVAATDLLEVTDYAPYCIMLVSHAQEGAGANNMREQGRMFVAATSAGAAGEEVRCLDSVQASVAGLVAAGAMVLTGSPSNGDPIYLTDDGTGRVTDTVTTISVGRFMPLAGVAAAGAIIAPQDSW